MKTSKKVAFSFILVALGLLFIELVSFVAIKIVGYESRDQSYIFHPLRHHAYRPDSLVEAKADRLPTDQYGYVKTIPEVKDPEMTIVLTGSSSLRSPRPFTGTQDTIASQLQKKLQERYGHKIRVQSLAIAGYSSFSEMETLYEYLEKNKLPADLIVSVNGLFAVNNFTHKVDDYLADDDLYPLYDEKASKRIVDIMDGRPSTIMVTFYQVISKLNLNTIQLVKYISSKMPSDKIIEKKTDRDKLKDNEKIENLYLSLQRREHMNYDIIGTIARSYHVPYMLVLLPAKYDWSLIPDDQKSPEFEFQSHYKKKFYQEMIGARNEYPVLDISSVFDNVPVEKSPYGDGDPVHYNREGSEMIADKLFEITAPYVGAELKKRQK